jgi:hypothetical protein
MVMRSATHQSAARLRGFPIAILATVGLAAALLIGTQVATAAAASFSWSSAIEAPVTPPTNAGGKPNALYDWGACLTAESCVGVGSYEDESGNRRALAAPRTNGSWGQAVEIALPPGAATSGQTAGFSLGNPTVACTGPDTCVAVGFYTKEGVGQVPMVAEETSGSWGQAREIEPPANAESIPEARLFSIACSAPGSCVAGGEYRDEHGREAMVAEEIGGSWGRASEIVLPANAASNPMAGLSQVACSASGSCVALGTYFDSAPSTLEAMVATESNGIWGQASQVALPAGAGSTPRSTLDSVVCVASGPCVADGKYTDGSGNEEAMVAEETGGSWGQASEVTPPANAASNPEVEFELAPISIACPASGSCLFASKYIDSSGDQEVMAAEETGGSWGQASEIAPPANAASNPRATLNPGCPPLGPCVLIGAYEDEGSAREAMVAEQAGSSWSQASEVAPPANAATDPGILFGEVMCPASGFCLAFGEYENNGGKTGDMEVFGLTAPENTVAPMVSGTAGVGRALTCSRGTWTASPTSFAYKWLRDGVAIGGAGSSTYPVTAADEGHGISCEVTATNATASRSARSSNSLVVPARLTVHEEPKAVATGSVSLVKSIIRFQNGKGPAKLLCTGTATCTGTLRLTAKGKAEKRKKGKVKTIGRAAFSIAPGTITTVSLTLTTAGGTLLKADHGKLRASLIIFKSSPSPTSTQRMSIQLVKEEACQRNG